MKKVSSIAAKDEWVASAMTDDQMVAELIIRLKHAGTVMAENPAANLPPLTWGIRQQRSRSSRFGVAGPIVSLKKDVDSARASPMTPLSWSGGSGSSGGGGGDSGSPSVATADGFEDTSRQASCSTSTISGSKAFHINDITFIKRLKKKKSSSELKDEENTKLKERLDLEKEIASLQATFDEQNVRNQRLKRIKLDLNSGRLKNDLIHKSQPETKQCIVESKTANSETQGRSFFLPDLNMVPSEDDIV